MGEPRRKFRKYYYRGVEVSQLLGYKRKDMLKLVTSRVRRKFNRGLKAPEIALVKKIRKAKMNAKQGEKPKVVKTHLRGMVVLPEMVAARLGVYNGKGFIMVGRYLGEFSITYVPVRHAKAGHPTMNEHRYV